MLSLARVLGQLVAHVWQWADDDGLDLLGTAQAQFVPAFIEVHEQDVFGRSAEEAMGFVHDGKLTRKEYARVISQNIVRFPFPRI